MNRLIAFGLGLACAGTAAAQYPVTPYSGTTWNQQRPPVAQPASPLPVPAATPADVTQPLPAAVSAMQPVGYGTCVGGVCPSADGRTGRPCLQRFKEWLCFQPGPPVLPKCIPNPYHAPLRHYFTCLPGCRGVVGGCNLTPWGTDGCAQAGGLGLFQRNDCRAGTGVLGRNECGTGIGILDRLRPGRCDSTCPVPVDYSYAPQATTTPYYPPANECHPCWEPEKRSVLDRLLSVFRSRRAGCEPAGCGYPVYPVPAAPMMAPAATLGPVVPTNLNGYRFAAPTAVRPFTNP